VGGTVWALLTRAKGDIEIAIPYGMATAKFTVEWDGPVSPEINAPVIEAAVTTAKSWIKTDSATTYWRLSELLIRTQQPAGNKDHP